MRTITAGTWSLSRGCLPALLASVGLSAAACQSTVDLENDELASMGPDGGMYADAPSPPDAPSDAGTYPDAPSPPDAASDGGMDAGTCTVNEVAYDNENVNGKLTLSYGLPRAKGLCRLLRIWGYPSTSETIKLKAEGSKSYSWGREDDCTDFNETTSTLGGGLEVCGPLIEGNGSSTVKNESKNSCLTCVSPPNWSCVDDDGQAGCTTTTDTKQFSVSAGQNFSLLDQELLGASFSGSVKITANGSIAGTDTTKGGDVDACDSSSACEQSVEKNITVTIGPAIEGSLSGTWYGWGAEGKINGGVNYTFGASVCSDASFGVIGEVQGNFSVSLTAKGGHPNVSASTKIWEYSCTLLYSYNSCPGSDNVFGEWECDAEWNVPEIDWGCQKRSCDELGWECTLGHEQDPACPSDGFLDCGGCVDPDMQCDGETHDCVYPSSGGNLGCWEFCDLECGPNDDCWADCCIANCESTEGCPDWVYDDGGGY